MKYSARPDGLAEYFTVTNFPSEINPSLLGFCWEIKNAYLMFTDRIPQYNRLVLSILNIAKDSHIRYSLDLRILDKLQESRIELLNLE